MLVIDTKATSKYKIVPNLQSSSDNQEFPTSGQPSIHGTAGFHPPLGAGEGDRAASGSVQTPASGRAVAKGGRDEEERRGEAKDEETFEI